MDGAVELVHATAVAVGGRAVLIRGPSGCGKSDLALRCLACAPGPFLPEPAALVADDQVEIARVGSTLRASAPHAIRGLIEVRGLGIVTVASVASAEVVLAADLVSPADVERLPEPAQAARIQGIDVPVVRLAPFEASAPIKLLLALAMRARPGA